MKAGKIIISVITVLLVLVSAVIADADVLDSWQKIDLSQVGHISYVSNVFVSVGSNGTIMTSPDGVTWTTRTSGTPDALKGYSFSLNGVAYGGNTFVAVGDYGTVLTSPDGVTWTTRTSGTLASYNSDQLEDVAYGNNTFVAVGNEGTIRTSPDGITWTSQTSGTLQKLASVTYGNNTFVAVGAANGAESTILTSSDGVTWTARTTGTSDGLSDVVYGNNTFVAVGVDGASTNPVSPNGSIFTSPDGVTWTLQKSGADVATPLGGVTYGNNFFVAVGAWNSGIMLTSPDGATWTARNPGTTAALYCAAYGNNTFVVGGGNFILKAGGTTGGNGAACTYSVSPATKTVSASAVKGAVSVSTRSGCAWTASSDSGWLTITSGSGGTGKGTVKYSVTANPGVTQRKGILTIGGKNVTVTQNGAPCKITSISKTKKSFDKAGGTDSFDVVAPSGCSWTATVKGSSTWIKISSESGTGNGTVTYSAAANGNNKPRSGSIIIAASAGKKIFTVSQTKQ